jgi:hypothetical protein
MEGVYQIVGLRAIRREGTLVWWEGALVWWEGTLVSYNLPASPHPLLISLENGVFQHPVEGIACSQEWGFPCQLPYPVK